MVVSWHTGDSFTPYSELVLLLVTVLIFLYIQSPALVA